MRLHAKRHSFFQALSTRYREACETAQTSVRIATEFDSLLDYSVGHFFEASALLFLGEWGRMRKLLHAAIDPVKKNGHQIWEVLFGLLEAYSRRSQNRYLASGALAKLKNSFAPGENDRLANYQLGLRIS